MCETGCYFDIPFEDWKYHLCSPDGPAYALHMGSQLHLSGPNIILIYIYIFINLHIRLKEQENEIIIAWKWYQLKGPNEYTGTAYDGSF